MRLKRSIILDEFGRPYKRPPRKSVYDSAEDGATDRRHWARGVDNLSAALANSLTVRKTLRERARYEFANNSYAKGLFRGIANDLIGTGPKIQFESEDRNLKQRFIEWSREVSLTAKLHTARVTKGRDGEVFFVVYSDDALRGPIKLNVMLVETDRVTDPDWAFGLRSDVNDGITYDPNGRPLTYTILDGHPADITPSKANSKTYDAQYVFHWYQVDRPGQLRGIPELTAGLPLFAQLRRYTKAVLTAAETAADFAVLLKTDYPADGEDPSGEPFDTIELERGLMTTLPAGVTAEQFKAEQPTTTHKEFKGELLREGGREVNVPYNRMSGDSSSYNYSSAKLDQQIYERALEVDRYELESVVLGNLVRMWIKEASMMPGLLPSDLVIDSTGNVPHKWYWDGSKSIDPLKDAVSDGQRLQDNTITLAEIYAEKGQDWEEALKQRAKEIALLRELGIVGDASASTGDQVTKDAALQSRLDLVGAYSGQ